MNELRKLIDGHEGYPPSEVIWRQVVSLIQSKNTKERRMNDLRQQLEKEFNKYKPSLPEPLICKFYHDNKNFYMDGSGNIYETDAGNPLVGNLVGEITENHEIKINGEVVWTMQPANVQLKEMYEDKYYVDKDGPRAADKVQSVYLGFHPNQTLLYRIGKMNGSKIVMD